MNQYNVLIFATFKPFVEEFVTEQTNALHSWKALRCNPKIIILGDEYGVKELCEKENVIHHETLLKTKYGTPLVSDIFEQGWKYAHDDDICIFVNGDIILTNSLCDGLDRFVKENPDYNKQTYMLTSIRYDWFNFRPIDFSNPDWETDINADMKGEYALPTGIDLYIHRKNTIQNIPESGIAKFAYDGWIMGYAIANFDITIDTTSIIKIYHQFGKWFQNRKVCERKCMSKELTENAKNITKIRIDDGYLKCLITDCDTKWSLIPGVNEPDNPNKLVVRYEPKVVPQEPQEPFKPRQRFQKPSLHRKPIMSQNAKRRRGIL